MLTLECVNTIISGFTRKSYRRAVTKAEVDGLVEFYNNQNSLINNSHDALS